GRLVASVLEVGETFGRLGTCRDQGLVTLYLLDGVRFSGARTLELCPGLLDVGVLLKDLRLAALDVRFARGNRRLRLLQDGVVLAAVEPHERLARSDRLVVSDEDFGDIAGRLRRDGDVVRL